jgi:hypothetical protein
MSQGKPLSEDEMSVLSQAIADSEFTPEAGLGEALRNRTRSISRRKQSSSSSSSGQVSYRLQRYGLEAGGADIAVRPDLDLLRFPEDQVGGGKVREQRRQQLKELRRLRRQQQEPQYVGVLQQQQQKWLQQQQVESPELEESAEGRGGSGEVGGAGRGKVQQDGIPASTFGSEGSFANALTQGESVSGANSSVEIPAFAGSDTAGSTNGGLGDARGLGDWQKAAVETMQGLAEGLERLQDQIQEQQRGGEGASQPLSGWLGGMGVKLGSIMGLGGSKMEDSSQDGAPVARDSIKREEGSSSADVPGAAEGGAGAAPSGASFRVPPGMMDFELLQKERSRALLEEMLQERSKRGFSRGSKDGSVEGSFSLNDSSGAVIVVLTSCGVRAIEDAWLDMQ